MVEVTPDATQHLISLRRERGFTDSDGARLARNAGRVGLTFTGAPEPDDRVIDGAGIAIYVSPDIDQALEKSVIDTRAEDGKTVLYLRRPTQRTSGAANPA